MGVLNEAPTPVPMMIFCPACGEQHVDKGEWAELPHRSHRCEICETVWRDCDVPTVGVARIETKGRTDNWDAEWACRVTHRNL